MGAARKLTEGIGRIPELMVLGPPDATIVTWAARGAHPAASIDVYAVADQMEARGWSVDRQQRPASVHCTVTSNHLPVIDDYLRDLTDAVARVKAHPEVASSGNAAMYGMMAKVPFRGMIRSSVRKVMEGLYGPTALAPDPAELAAQGGGFVDKLVAEHGAKLNKMLDHVEAAKERLARVTRRR
jgi:hypothetical protein